MKRVVELAGHAAEALAEPLEATALRPILAELEPEMADDRVWRRVRTNAPILHVPGDEAHAFGQRNRFVAAAAWLGALEAEEADGVDAAGAPLPRRVRALRAVPTSRRSPASPSRRSLPRSRRSSRSWSG